MVESRSRNRAGKVGNNRSRAETPRATSRKKKPAIKTKIVAQPTSRRRGVKGPPVVPGKVEGAKLSSGGPNKGSRAEKAAGAKPASRLRLATAGDSELIEQLRETIVNQIRTEVVRPLGDQVEQLREDNRELREDNRELREDNRELREDNRELREDNRALRGDLPKLIFDGLQNFFRRCDVPLATSLSPARPDNHQSANEAPIPDEGRDHLDGGQQVRSAGTAAVVHSPTGDKDDAVKSAKTEANYRQLYDYGRARRQLPLELLLAMYRAEAIEGTGPNGEDDPAKGFVWNKSPQSNQNTLRSHRDMLEAQGFIRIPHRTHISEKAKKRTGRKGDAAGPGYITAKAVDVCEYIIEHGLEKSLTSKNRLTTRIK